MSQRLFIAIGFTERFSREVDGWLKKVRRTADQKEISVRWTPSDNLHVTLSFLGNTPEPQIPKIEDVLREVSARHPPFALKIKNVGGFPELERARVLWLGVQRSKTLLHVQEDLDSALAPFREAKTESRGEQHDYTPHLTFGRLRSAKSCRDLLSPFAHAQFGRQEVTEIILYQSIQSGNFTVYKPLSRWPLCGPEKQNDLEEDFEVG